MKNNALSRTVQHWLCNLPIDLQRQLQSESLLSSSWRFHKYAPLLLLPSGTFTRGAWAENLALLPPELTEQLYAAIAAALGVTHIAEQGAIPRVSTGAATGPARGDHEAKTEQENILRAPLALRPLHGDFGPLEDASSEAFQRALWVSVRQNGIAQVFAPLHSMFANGNVGEKRRVLELARETNQSGESAAAAVDLYAGIGYFAFSYARAGYRPVLCWELNPWSLEGMRRGAKTNRWSTHSVPLTDKTRDSGAEAGNGSLIDSEALTKNLVIFHESNAHALNRIQSIRSQIPRVRHVNCGYLPSSAPVWSDAVHILDSRSGGWVHAHENCAVADIEQRAAEVEALMAAAAGPRRVVHCEHVERVKSYAPGVMHCVFDVFVGPEGSGE